MIKEFICVLCPNGCELRVELDDNNTISKLEGATCQRGGEYVQQEIFAPQRNIATSVKVVGGNMPLVSVRLSEPIPKEKIFDVMDKIKEIKLEAPVSLGQVIIKNVLGLERDVIATKQILREQF